MSKFEAYESQEENPMVAGEPVMAYGVSSADAFLASLPHDLMQPLLDHALVEHRAGRCIPHSRIDELLDTRLGWK